MIEPGTSGSRTSRREFVATATSLMAGGIFVGRRAFADERFATESRMEFLENDFVRVGVDLSIGGSITYLAKRDAGENLVNSHDWGRQVQMSYYAPPIPFEPRGKRPQRAWRGLGWNPIQSGDAYGHPAAVLDFRREDDALVVETRPMHWPLENEPAECTFRTRILLDGPLVRATCRLANARTDRFDVDARDQELPAVYTNGPYHRLIAYSGDRPFEGAELTEIPKRGPQEGWSRFFATERWVALVDDDGLGLGVLSPETTEFLGGFSGTPGSGGTKDPACGYVAPVRKETLDAKIVHDYSYALVVGPIDEIRQAAKDEFARVSLPEWRFGPSRAGWTLKNATDSGYPIAESWEILPSGDDPQAIGPPTFWRADRAPTLRIEAACEGGESTATVYLYPLGRDEAVAVPFALDAREKTRACEVSLASIAGYEGGMRAIRIDPPQGCRRFRLASVALVGG